VLFISYLVYRLSFDLLGKEKMQKVKCELTVPICNYKGIGLSETNKHAQKEATKDFLLFLMRQNIIPPIPKVLKIKFTLILCIILSILILFTMFV